MKIYKKAKIGIIVEVLVILVIGFVVWHILNSGIQETASAVANPLKKMLGIESKEDLEKQKEAERVSKELADRAVNVYTQFADKIERCTTDYYEDRSCICANIDFTQLNEYSLKISSRGRTSVLELLDSRKVSVKDKQYLLDNFLIGPLDVSILPSSASRETDYSRPTDISKRIEQFNPTYTLFSKDQVIFNKDNADIKKFEGKMKNINFIKVAEDTVVIDEQDFGMRKCGEELDCVKRYVLYPVQQQLRAGELPDNRILMCKKMNGNRCFEYNNQFIQKTDKCQETRVTTVPFGFATPLILKENSIKKLGLPENFEIKQLQSEALSKFEYIYDIKYLIKDENNNKLKKLISELNNQGFDIKIYVVSGLEPFADTDVGNAASFFTNQIFKNYKPDVLIIIAIEDNKAEMIVGDKAKEILFPKTSPSKFLEQFTALLS